jgi:hypothetical protein
MEKKLCQLRMILCVLGWKFWFSCRVLAECGDGKQNFLWCHHSSFGAPLGAYTVDSSARLDVAGWQVGIEEHCTGASGLEDSPWPFNVMGTNSRFQPSSWLR